MPIQKKSVYDEESDDDDDDESDDEEEEESSDDDDGDEVVLENIPANNGPEMDAIVPVAGYMYCKYCFRVTQNAFFYHIESKRGVKDINGSAACLAQVCTSTSSDVSHHYLRNPIQDQQHVYYASLTTLDPHTVTHQITALVITISIINLRSEVMMVIRVG
ncbi:hypothetical protein Q3G72_000091 [Acer saccharum]|nr:hypothetical protein Q3G72_000091 [Acer saccharum]